MYSCVLVPVVYVFVCKFYRVMGGGVISGLCNLVSELVFLRR